MSWQKVSTGKPRGYMGYVQIHRSQPPEWRQSFTERDNWHQFRTDQKRRRATLEPLATIGSFLTGLGQTA